MANFSTVGIPSFTFSDIFTYFNHLSDSASADNSHLGHEKIALYNQASSSLTNAVNQSMRDADTETIKAAIEFLGGVAANERKKELAAVNQYKNKIKEQIPERLRKNKRLDKALKNIEKIDLENNPERFDDFYLELTEAINIIRQDELDYVSRLKQLIAKNIKDSTTYKRLAERQIEYRIYGDIEGLYRSMIGIQERSDENKFAGIIRDYTMKFARQKGLLDDKNILMEDLMGILAAIMADLETFIQHEYYEQNQGIIGKDNDISKIDAKVIEIAANKYFDADQAFQTRVQRAIDERGAEFSTIIRDYKSQMGIKKLTAAEQINRDTVILKQQNSPTASRRNKYQRELSQRFTKNNTISDNRMDRLQTLTWTARTKKNPRHGTIYEAIRASLSEALAGGKIHASAGADTIMEGEIVGSINTRQFREINQERIQEIIKEIENYYNHMDKREERFDSQTEYFSKMNEGIRRIIDDLEDDLKAIGVLPEDLFIYHESLKLYSRFEQHKENKFEGRTMQFLNAFDELYSASDYSGLALLQQDVLYTIAANLSTLAVGGKLKDPVEKYVSIFAGLLIFDDIQNMAMEAAEGTALEKTTKNVHLYLINDMYIPSSMVLTQIYENLKNGLDQLSADRAATAEILTEEADSTIGSYLKTNYSGGKRITKYKVEDWDWVANQTTKGTKIRITFFASFNQFLQKLASL